MLFIKQTHKLQSNKFLASIANYNVRVWYTTQGDNEVNITIECTADDMDNLLYNLEFFFVLPLDKVLTMHGAFNLLESDDPEVYNLGLINIFTQMGINDVEEYLTKLLTLHNGNNI